MSQIKKAPASETTELLNKIYVGFFFCLAITNGGKALKFFVSSEGQAVHILDFIRVGALIGVLVLLGLFFWKSRLLQSAGQRVFGGSEFFHLVFFKAMVISWFFTFVMLMFLSELSEQEVMFVGKLPILTSLPGSFYLSVAVSMMLFVYCIAYYLLYRSGASTEDDA